MSEKKETPLSEQPATKLYHTAPEVQNSGGILSYRQPLLDGSTKVIWINVDRGFIRPINMEEQKVIEGSPKFKTGEIYEYNPLKTDGIKEKTELDKHFSNEKLIEISAELTPEEIQNALNILLEGKKAKREKEKLSNTQSPGLIKIGDITPKELKDELSGRNVEFKGNASKEVLYQLYVDNFELPKK